jgi:predicted dehydrogenase
LTDRVRVGVVGCGLIAQVMHLHYLNELSDEFELVAVCDISEEVAVACAKRFGARTVHTRWPDLLEQPLDAVLVLTSGDHAPVAIAAAQAGKHVFVEKPMALSSEHGARVLDAAETAGVRLMVGMMKRYDPAYERLVALLPEWRSELRLVRATTLESPLGPYVAHYPLVTASDVAAEVLDELRRRDEQAIDSVVADAETRFCYRWILLDCLVHEFNALRGALGEPSEVVSAQLSRTCVAVNLRFGETECHLSWVDLPGIARYKQEFAFYAPDQRLTLELPSPFLRNAPSRLLVEGGESGTANSWEREEVVSYDEAFKRELREFAECVRTGREPRTPGADGLADLRLCEAVARANEGLDMALAAGSGMGER